MKIHSIFGKNTVKQDYSKILDDFIKNVEN